MVGSIYFSLLLYFEVLADLVTCPVQDFCLSDRLQIPKTQKYGEPFLHSVCTISGVSSLKETPGSALEAVLCGRCRLDVGAGAFSRRFPAETRASLPPAHIDAALSS